MNVPIPCLCAPKDGKPRHPAGDSLVLRDTLDFRTALAIRNDVAVLYVEEPDAGTADVLAVLTESYLNHGIGSWTIQDAADKPLPVSRASIRETLLARIDVAMDVGEVADKLYGETVILPLLTKASTSSPATPTDESTSPPTDSSTERPKRSKRSSISTIPTAATEVTSSSLDGDSSLSPSSESAA